MSDVLTCTSSFAEIKAKEALTLSVFKGFDLDKTKETLKDMLADIGKHDMFTEYTKHDISHVDGMLKLLEFIIPDSVKNLLTPTDWIMIVLSVYFHDLGMLITMAEFNARHDNLDYLKFLKNDARDYSNTKSEDEREKLQYQNFVRCNHGERIYKWIKNIGDQPEAGNPISKLLYDMLHYIDENFRNDLAVICKSHSDKFSDIARELKTDIPYAQGKEYQANLLYAAAVLRTADLMHVNYERTPTTAYLLVSPQDEYSRREWVKQKSVISIRPRQEYDKDNKLDNSAKIHRIEIIGRFKDSSAYKSFMSYLDEAELQLKETHEICKDSMERHQNGYDFPWDEICRDKIEALNFSGVPLRFDLDTKNILNLLVGHTLYSQINVVLRELAQNSIDAVRLMNKEFKDGDEDYTPTVKIEWDSSLRELCVMDNGTGMNEDIIRNYFMKVGSSRYQSEEFKAKNKQFHSISRFGIGVLTCFMISDEFSITTKFNGEDKVYSVDVGGMEKEFMLRYDADPKVLINQNHGTTIRISVRDDACINNIEEKLREWIIVPGCQVSYSADGQDPVSIGYTSEEDAVSSYLRSHGVSIDSGEYKLGYNNIGCSTIYYLLCKNKTFGYWHICSLPQTRRDPLAPIGICVEGIRVSSMTPGFDTRNYFVFVNCKGEDSPSTNVARDRLEDSPEMANVFRNVYKTYLDTIIEQIDSFSSKYSLSWASDNAIRQIDNLINDRYDSLGLTNRAIFDECLMDENFILVDDGDEYKRTSINNLSDDIWTMENHAYSSAVSLVQEIHNCSKTPLAITKELMPEGKVNVDKVYTEHFFDHYLNQLFLNVYQVKEINVDTSLRKIEFCWEKKGDYWYCLDLTSSRRYKSTRLFIQKNDSLMTNVETETIAVRSDLGYFLLKNNKLCNTLCGLYESSDERKSLALQIMGAFTTYLLERYTTFDEDEINKFFNSDENNLRNELWDIVGPKDKFLTILKELNYQKVDFSKYYIYQ